MSVFSQSYPYTVKNCEDEPIHRIGRIQDIGVLLVLDVADYKVSRASENWQVLFKLESMIGSNAEELFYSHQQENLHAFLSSMHTVCFRDNKRECTSLILRNGDSPSEIENLKTVVAYADSKHLYLEFEVLGKDQNLKGSSRELTAAASSFEIPRISAELPMGKQAQELADWVFNYAHYDRVMVYKFDTKHNGCVIAETKQEHLESFLGLHYPASDIPAQARQLYLLNWIRIIEDVDKEPLRILGSPSGNSYDLDLSHSMIRASSPIHTQYLSNMGVRASLSVSLVVNNRLWGLIACHHYSPKNIGFSKRLNLEVVGQSMSYQLDSKEKEEASFSKLRRIEAINKCVLTLIKRSDSVLSFEKILPELSSIQKSCGFVYYNNKELHTAGIVPCKKVIDSIVKMADDYKAIKPFCATNLLNVKGAQEDDSYGFLAVPIATKNNSIGTIWFREEELQTVNWAGKPKDLKSASEEERLSPRGSFALWKENIKGHCLDWTDEDIVVAEKFNLLLFNHVVSRLNETESNLRAMKKLDAAKDQFLATISHELRTPLNAILGWAQLATNENATDHDKDEAIRVIHKNANMQNELIGDLLEYSRIITGNLTLVYQQIVVPNLIEDMCETFESLAAEKNIQLLREARGHSLNVMGDMIRLKQVLGNLVNNAIKYTPPGGKVTVSVSREGAKVIIAVQDTGKGIPVDDLESVFKSFHQLRVEERAGGIGMGLAIAKNLTELHGGTISAHSLGEGYGALFRVELPTVPVVKDGDIDVQSKKVGLAKKQSKKLDHLTVLIVEDEVDSRVILGRSLTAQGAKVIQAGNGEQALEILADDDKIQLVISDIGMPVMDGFGLIKELRLSSEKRLRHLKAVALTAYSFTEDRVAALQAGFDSYVSKPVSFDELIAVVLSILPAQKNEG